jgi:hypothetical protein
MRKRIAPEDRIQRLLDSYPRERPPLSEAHLANYVDEYKINRGSEGVLYKLLTLLERWGHKRVADQQNHGDILEIGAGTLNHVPYESRSASYDCIEPFQALFADSPHLSRIRSMYDDIGDVPATQRYSRIISIAVLEHLQHLPNVLAASARHLQSDGKFQAVIPTEGGFLWGASWRLTTGIAYRLRTGLDYKTVMRHEHINDSKEIIELVRQLFSAVKISRFPLPGHHSSFYTYIEASAPNTAVASQFLEG